LPGVYSFLRQGFSWHKLDLQGMLNRYRYLSLAITSIFYLIGPPAAPLYLKLVVVFCLFLEAHVFIRVYSQNSKDVVKKLLIVLELAGLLLVLLLTGGLESPFMWYAINPILLSSTLLPYYFCWGAAACFIASAGYLQQYFAQHPGFFQFFWPEHAHIALIFVLIILVAQLFHHLVSELSRQAEIMEKRLEHIKSLYEVLEVFSHHSDPQEAVNLFASYCRDLTGAAKVILWAEVEVAAENPRDKIVYVVRGPRQVLPEKYWYPYVKELFQNRDQSWKVDYANLPWEGEEKGGFLSTVRIKSNTRVFGVLSAYCREAPQREEIEETLVFLGNLCAAALERRSQEDLSERLILAEEKERIARQMHDTVTQNLFGLLHGLNAVQRDGDISTGTEDHIALLKKTAQRCLRDLRFSIYNLSSTKRKEEPFAEEIKNYLQDLKRLNVIEVEFNWQGILNDLSFAEHNALFRIIREAVSNAIRHGSCSTISVYLEAAEREIRLEVVDDGCGFNEDQISFNARKGLGLLSMKELARNIGGELIISSKPGKGTRITCQVSRHLQSNISSEGVVSQ